MSDTAAPAKASFASRFLRRLVTITLLLGVLVLVFATWANYRRSGTVSFRVFDAAWWGVGRETSQPYVDRAKDMASSTYTAVWGEGGLVDEAKAWLAREDQPAETQTAPSDTAAVESAGAERDDHEAAFRRAEASFEQGLFAWQRARPADATAPPDAAALDQARSHFEAVATILDRHLPAYNATAGKNLRVLKDAEDLQALNRRMLDRAKDLR